MKTHLLLSILFIFCYKSGFSQLDSVSPTDYRCGFLGPQTDAEREKLPYFGNNDYLKEVLLSKAGIDLGKSYQDEIKNKGYIPFNIHEYNNAQQSLDKQQTNSSMQTASANSSIIPITVYVYRKTDGTDPAATQAEVTAFFDEVRRIYEPTGLKISLNCNIVYPPNTTFHTLNIANHKIMFRQNRSDENLTVHLVKTMTDAEGVAAFPTDPILERYACAVSTKNRASVGKVANIIAHEIGHTLGLLHTHQARLNPEDRLATYNGACNKCHQESVSRSTTQGILCYKTGSKTCEINGDMLCDTPADPLLLGSVDGNCNILRNSLIFPEDKWNDKWQPNTRNVMAYGEFKCLTTFSASQVAIMYDNRKSNWTNSASLTGPTALCANQTGNFTAPIGATSYRWAVPSGWTVVSGQGTRQATIRAGNSSGNIYAYPSCGNPRLDRLVSVTSTSLTVSGSSTLCPNRGDSYTTTFYSGANYTWTTTGFTIVSGQGTNTINVSAPSNFNGGTISVSMTRSTGCGASSGPKQINKAFNCPASLAQDEELTEGYAIMEGSTSTEESLTEKQLTKENNNLKVELVYPNPSSEQLTLQLNRANECMVQLINEYGKEVFSGNFCTDKIVLPVSTYSNGLYFLRVLYAEESVVKRIYITK